METKIAAYIVFGLMVLGVLWVVVEYLKRKSQEATQQKARQDLEGDA